MTGVLGLFDARDALLRAVAAAKAERVAIVTAFSPAYDPAVVAAHHQAAGRAGRTS